MEIYSFPIVMQGISSFPFQTSCIFPESFLEITFNGCYIACHFVGISGEVGSNVATRYGEPNTHLSAKGCPYPEVK